MIQERPSRGPRSRASRRRPGTVASHERYAASEDQAWLGWWEGRVYRKSPATLLNISHGGAKLIAEVTPPRRSTVWICLDGPRRTEWIEAGVLSVARLQDQSAVVRVLFREICPYTFFEVAVYGHNETTAETSLPGRPRHGGAARGLVTAGRIGAGRECPERAESRRRRASPNR